MFFVMALGKPLKILVILGRRTTDVRRSCRTVNNTQQPPVSKIIGSSAALNQTTNNVKKNTSKKKINGKHKHGNETTPTNLARQILNNLNIFGKSATDHMVLL